MIDDLAYASATVDWAEGEVRELETRMRVWLDKNVIACFRGNSAHPESLMLLSCEKEPIPLRFNVEIGIYIHALRSSLDMLAVALAARNGITRLDDVYFPIVKDVGSLNKPGRARKFLNKLSVQDRQKIESFKAYKGGNDIIWQLHELNRLSKHRRLLAIDTRPAMFALQGWSLEPFTSPEAFVGANGETLLGPCRI